MSVQNDTRRSKTSAEQPTKSIFKLPQGSGKKTIKRKGEYKRESGKTQTEITSGSTDVEGTRKQRILHSTPVKIVENSLEKKENWIDTKL